MRELSLREKLAYCAGVIDSDGTIGIKRNTYSVRVIGDSQQPTYSERVCVKQVESAAVDLLKALFGGSRYLGGPGSNRGRPILVWQVSDRKAIACLKALVPYLRIKREQALNCLALRALKEKSKRAKVARGRGHRGSAPRPIELTTQMEALKVRASELNRVGIR